MINQAINRTIRLLFLSLLILVGSLTTAKAIVKGDSLQLIGKVYNNKSVVRGLIVNVYVNNDKIKAEHVKNSNRFRLNVPYNAMLTIEITAPDFHAKRFIIDSNLPNGVKQAPRYEFDIDIFRENEIEGVNSSILDFPVGLVDYDPKKKEFRRNKKYTKRMKKVYLNLWNEAEMIKRTAAMKE